jgi:hypothetical protein
MSAACSPLGLGRKTKDARLVASLPQQTPIKAMIVVAGKNAFAPGAALT